MMRVLGMISGTSFDAVEALLTELDLEGGELSCRLIEHRSVPYPEALRQAIAAVLPPSPTTIEQVCKLDVEIGQHFGEVAAGFRAHHGELDVVCSHGQTVFHWVVGGRALGTLQLGEAAWIAERSGATVVSDVRNADIVLGGHGAPLASLLDVLLVGTEPALPTGLLNLGGIANVTVTRAGAAPLAFDIGPANALIDAAAELASGGREHFDADGARAARGGVHAELAERLLDDAYFALAPPKSTGKEYFNAEYLRRAMVGPALGGDDLLATVTAATAESIASALRALSIETLFVSGGGTRNPSLMAAIGERLPGVTLRLTDELGVPEAAKEALIFAVVGFLSLHGIPATIPSCTGAARPALLGAITPGPRWPPVTGRAGAFPSRLTMLNGAG